MSEEGNGESAPERMLMEWAKLIGPFIATALLGVATWYLGNLDSNIKELQDAVSGVRTEVRILKSERESLDDYRVRVRVLERAVDTLSERVKGFPTEIPPAWFLERVRKLEVRVRDLEKAEPGGGG